MTVEEYEKLATPDKISMSTKSVNTIDDPITVEGANTITLDTTLEVTT